MDESWSRLQQLLKRGFAAALFVLLLVGGSAAAFCAFAAAMTALSGRPDVTVVPSTTVAQATGTTDQSGSAQLPAQTPANADTWPTQTTPGTTQPAQPTGTSASSGLSDSGTDGYYSPVGDAIDSGGVVLGMRLQHAFGSLIGGLLQTLFLTQKQPVTQAVGSTGTYNDATQGASTQDTGVGQP